MIWPIAYYIESPNKNHSIITLTVFELFCYAEESLQEKCLHINLLKPIAINEPENFTIKLIPVRLYMLIQSFCNVINIHVNTYFFPFDIWWKGLWMFIFVLINEKSEAYYIWHIISGKLYSGVQTRVIKIDTMTTKTRK